MYHSRSQNLCHIMVPIHVETHHKTYIQFFFSKQLPPLKQNIQSFSVLAKITAEKVPLCWNIWFILDDSVITSLNRQFFTSLLLLAYLLPTSSAGWWTWSILIPLLSVSFEEAGKDQEMGQEQVSAVRMEKGIVKYRVKQKSNNDL